MHLKPALGSLILLGFAALAQQSPPPAAPTRPATPASSPAPARSGIPFTAAQATRGQEVYTAHCAMCHGAQLQGGGAPPLAGEAFDKRWNGKTVNDLHFIAKTTMPRRNPDSLPAKDYLAVVSYILQQNGYRAGDAALEQTALKNYRIAP
ncbi:mono/diheme cytochrome c family protein [Deinobacterium chartae]|uniref:Mono/diheme cytochrome c family protein n=1 Tax=Deinobacterium chartae TaxID=521158 RepID=A0A841HVU1_9DEIO|nr:cytochrome c [Deinobacterium chartae]MBB6096784.1 mono/diheme cytochrome c family protein [Deinobacterium chartae]